ncbi:MAG TPA: metal ABC transporter ATP-binding protein [Syntrophomonadaceae bacterium]|nr:metal ABC transporter ATP-binding protein [Syntrophomonadaceae bacterium]
MDTNNNRPVCELCCTQLENFGVTMGNNVLLHDVNLHIHCGELTVLIGPNGAGKTTLLRAMLGELPHSGTLTYLDAKGERTGRPLIGYVPQKVEFDKGLPASVLDFCTACISQKPIWLLHSRVNHKRIQASLARVQADHLVHRKIGTLSGGELQRVLLACALDPLPDLLLLDEPVSGVDPSGMELFYEMVSSFRQEYDLSIILVSHDLTLAPRAANRLVLLNKSVLASGPPAQVLQDQIFSKTFGSILTSYAPIPEISVNIHH